MWGALRHNERHHTCTMPSIMSGPLLDRPVTQSPSYTGDVECLVSPEQHAIGVVCVFFVLDMPPISSLCALMALAQFSPRHRSHSCGFGSAAFVVAIMVVVVVIVAVVVVAAVVVVVLGVVVLSLAWCAQA
eukprot:3871304-Alexandrium_andersonii.AAC.1